MKLYLFPLLFLLLIVNACSTTKSKEEDEQEAEKITIKSLFERWEKKEDEMQDKAVILTGIVTNMQRKPMPGQSGFSLVEKESDNFMKTGVYCSFMREVSEAEVKSGQTVTVKGNLKDFFDKPSLENCELVK